MKAQLLVAVVAVTVIGMTGCGGQEAPTLPAAPVPVADTAATAANPAVSGTIVLPAGVTLAADMNIAVRLEDTSRADAAAVTIAEVMLRPYGTQLIKVDRADAPMQVDVVEMPAPAGAAPLAFAIEYAPAKIVAANTYGIRVKISNSQGKLLYTSTQADNVITRGNPVSGINIEVKPVAP